MAQIIEENITQQEQLEARAAKAGEKHRDFDDDDPNAFIEVLDW